MDTKKILLVDGNSLLYRAYYASAYGDPTNILRTKDGIATNAVYSFANMITALIKKGEYYDVKVAFDAGKKTFRHDKMEDYKGGRNETPDDLIQQFPIARELLDSMNIAHYEMEGIEADDLIGSMSKLINKENPDMMVHILTSDKDMYQLISERTIVMRPRSGTSDIQEVGLKELFDLWQIAPDQVPDFKGLMGDASDNLKGVAGVGEKTAIKLLVEYKSVENIYDNIENIKGKLKENLINDKDSAFLCKDIATIKTDVFIEGLELRKLNITSNTLTQFFLKYEMFSLVKRYENNAKVINKEEKIDYRIINSWSKEYEAEENSIYVESLDLNYHDGNVIGIAVSNKKGTFYLNYTNKVQLDIFSMEDETSLNDNSFNEFLKSDLIKNTYDIKRTVALLENMGYEVNFDSFSYDMMSVGYLLNPSVRSTFSNHLNLISRELNVEENDGFYGKGVKQNPDVDLDKKSEFISKKAFYLNETKEMALSEIENRRQTTLYRDLDLKLIKVLKSMEDHGVLIDKNVLVEQTKFAELNMQQIEQMVRDEAGDLIDHNFNIASPKQVKELLYDKLGLENKFKGSTNIEALEYLSTNSQIAVLLIEYRKWAKMYTTYLAGFVKYIKKDGKVHTIYNQNLTATGRLSSIEPNLQNISVRDEERKNIRKMFIVDPGFKFYSLDYSQIELRVMAQMANEHNMIDIFKRGGDIHKESAMKIFGLSNPNEVTSSMRRTAKVFNFGIMYGLSIYGLSKDLNISYFEAEMFIQKYYETFPGIKTFEEDVIEKGTKYGYVETMSKRRRYVSELTSINKKTIAFGERIAVNMPIQGTAADVLKIAMINIHEKLYKNNFETFISSQIHDEIIFSVKAGEEEEVLPMIREEMQKAFKILSESFGENEEIKVSLNESESSGDNWFELK